MRILIAIPALNEARIIADTLAKVRAFADRSLSHHQVSIVVADNGSDDGMDDIVRAAAAADGSIAHLRLSERGKGLAVRSAWDAYEADVYIFMDADLSVDLEALPPLIASIEKGADLAIGSRYHRDSVVKRSAFRKFVSWGYRTVLGAALETDVADLPCGFKAVRSHVVRTIVPHVRDNRWFFDTELVIRAERAGLRIEEVPVCWSEDHPVGRASKVRVAAVAKEYLRRVFALRRDLGPRDAGQEPVLRRVAASMSEGERRTVLGIASIIALLGLVPAIVGISWAQRHGWEWNGRSFLAPGDYAVYLSYIAQAKQGHLLMQNAATTEALVPVLNIGWLLVGWLAKLLWLTPNVAFIVARALLVFPFAAVAYLTVAYVFTDVRSRVTAFTLFMLGGGMGLWPAPFMGSPQVVDGIYNWPIDLWVAEANAFTSAIYSPHFTASWTFLLLALFLLLIAYETGRSRYGVYAGLSALALFQFHPFHAPTLWAVGFTAVVALTLTDRFRARQWLAYVWFVLVSLPAVAYHYWLTHWTANAEFMLHNNVNLTPALPFVIVGLGAVSVLAVVGWYAERRKRTATMSRTALLFFATWALTQLALCYSPLVFQRRLLEGLQFPLVMLSLPALVLIGRHRVFNGPLRPLAITLAGVLIFLPSSFSGVVRNLEASSAPSVPALSFFGRDEADMLAWIRKNTPEDAVIMSSGSLGNDVMGWGERYTYVAHLMNTVDMQTKLYLVRDFFHSMHDDARKMFVKANGIDYVLVGPSERSYGGTLSNSTWLWHAYSSGNFDLYKVME